MATFTFFDEFWGDLGEAVHNLGSNSFKIALSNTAPTVTTNAVFADITEITPGNGYTDNGHALDSVTWAETGAGTGIWQFTSADEVFTASGGSIGPFRYIVLYNDTPTSPADPLIGYLDYGSSITVTTGNTFTVDVGANGWFRLGDGTLA
jgi:hypothetical protein